MNRVIVLGVGNILLRDEGVGVRVVEALAERYDLPPEVEVVDGGTVGMDLLDTLAGCDHLLICDAVQTGAPPATVVKLADAEIPALFQARYSPHQLGLSEVLATLILMEEAPRAITLIGVVPADMELGAELSSEVASVVGEAVDMVAAELCALGFPLTLPSA
ncbi:MAG: HyaD/HybD family hydrogenase maturation endopeptidase [Candidatus Competibacteraceae bacterium]|nr:HyaD/HybD family hydrogenase maturation endopeptidase [Candidatus Competibacteraceae bacterium]MCP5124946.1 HyaD/HybD family hydrogenase maturation endopeptidase [Gammaproteobacteria bacterium]HRX71870.1 HyaD/HybD family hydrogenase maturation endopeptidase [Candidatus Competibacteraceae bacterium]